MLDGFIDTVTSIGAKAVGNSMYADSLEKFRTRYGNISPDAKVIVNVTIQRRRVDGVFNGLEGVRNAQDEESFSFGLNEGESFNKFDFMGFEVIFLDSVVVQPGYSVIIVNSNRLGAETYVKNGSQLPFTKSWRFPLPHPMCLNIKCEKCAETGSVSTKDPLYLDGRFWGPVAALMFVVTIIIILIVAKAKGKLVVQKSKFEAFDDYSEAFDDYSEAFDDYSDY